MATQFLSRTFPKTLTLASFFTRSLSTTASVSVASRSSFSSLSFIHRLRPVASAGIEFRRLFPLASARNFATRATASSLNDPNPNWSNRPPKETILLDGCDFEHWLVVMEKPEGDPTRDEIIDSYIKTLAQAVGSEEEARMKIYSVSTRHYYAFGALVSEELSYKIKELPRVRWVLPDSYLDVKNKDYGGEPFINGQAVPYDPKYHEEWVRNNARANERNRRNDRPRNADRSRNFERRRENIINRDMPSMANQANTGGYPPNMGRTPPSNPGGYPPNNMGGAPPSSAGGYPPNNMGGAPPSSTGGYPPNNMGGAPPSSTGGYPPNNMGGAPPNNAGGYPPNNMSGAPPSNQGSYPPNMGRAPPSHMGGVPPNNMGGVPPNNMGRVPPSNIGGVPPNSTYGNMQSNNPMGVVPPNNYPGMTPNNSNMGRIPPPNQNRGGMPPNAGWSDDVPGRDYQPNYNPNRDMGGPSGGNPYQG